MTITLYGLKNCDSCRKALKHLTDKGAQAELLDVRDHPPSREQLTDWCATFGRDVLINKRSTTWRTLTDAQKALTSDAQAVKQLIATPTLMKRPVAVRGKHKTLGANPADLDTLL